MRAQKRDSNEPDVIEFLEDNGYVVDRHYSPDPFDILVRRWRSPVGLRVEIKAPYGSLTDSQERELAEEGIVVVRSPEEALEAAKRYL